MLRLFKAGQVHRIPAERRKCAEPWGCLTCLYSRVGEPCMLQAVCPPACLCMSPIPLCPLSLIGKSQLPYIVNIDKAGREPTDYRTELHSTHVSPLKAMGTIYLSQSQGYGNTDYLSSPDMWVRKPHCLHLPYSKKRHLLENTCDIIT